MRPFFLEMLSRFRTDGTPVGNTSPLAGTSSGRLWKSMECKEYPSVVGWG